MVAIWMLLKTIIKGIFMGFVFALPVGPAALEGVKRTVSEGYISGLKVSLGAVSADAIDIILINIGLVGLLNRSPKTMSYFWIICGIIMIFLGILSIKKLRKTGDLDAEPDIIQNKKIKSMPYLTGLILGITNPLTHSLWITLSGTVFRTWSEQGALHYYLYLLFIIIGMALWLSILNFLTFKGYSKINHKSSALVNVLIAYAILIFGIVFMGYGLYKLIII